MRYFVIVRRDAAKYRDVKTSGITAGNGRFLPETGQSRCLDTTSEVRTFPVKESGMHDKFVKRMAVDPDTTVSDLARLTGMSRKSVSRAISAVSKDELVRLLISRLESLEAKVRALEYALVAMRQQRGTMAVSRDKVGGNGDAGIRPRRM